MGSRDAAGVIIVGAGASGLAVAYELARARVPSLLLEARDRLFGRVHTIVEPGGPGPIEVGAEFVHDAAPRTERLAAQGGVELPVVPDRHVWLEHGRARPTGDMDRVVHDVLQPMRRRARDRSVASILARVSMSRRRGADLARFYIEGYHAADADRISARSLLEAGGESEGPAQRRPVGGYARLLEGLRTALPPALAAVWTNAVVRAIDWRPTHARVTCTVEGRDRTLTARAVVLAVPVAVLRANAIEIRPMPAHWPEALARLETGAVEKLVLWFREAFWRDRFAGPRVPAFWHARSAAFPTFWTSDERPILTAWAGGPAAQALRGCTERERVDLAVLSLAHMFGHWPEALHRRLRAVHHHDWNGDPFGRGAYSYVASGGLSAQRRLTRPVADTLFLAGEAFAREGAGTVEAALASGERAGQQVAKTWRARTPATSRSRAARRSTRSGGRRS